jgi:flagellar biosynthesis GTPase FlhF
VRPGTATGAGQPPAAPAGSPRPSADPEALRSRAAGIRDLLGGRLDPGVDPGSLFELSLEGGTLAEDAASGLALLLDSMQARRAAGSPPGDALQAARQDLREAMAEFLRRPAGERIRLLRLHDTRRREAAQAEAERAGELARLAELELAADRLAAFLKGKLDGEVDVAPLLRVRLLEGTTDPAARLRSLVSRQAPPAPAPDRGDASTNASRLAAAEARLDALRAWYLALSPSQRAALEEQHHRRLSAEEEAARAAARAAREAEEEKARTAAALQMAETEAAKLAAEERMRLVSARAALAAAEADLQAIRQGAQASREQALGWIRRVRELEGRSLLDVRREPDADSAYERLVTELTALRVSLARGLDEFSSGKSRVPPLPPPPEALLDDGDLQQRRTALADQRRDLRATEDGLRWDRVDAARDAMVAMNQVRLRLLDLLSPGKRAALQGFERPGIQQGLREVTQIALEFRYHRHALPRLAARRLEALRSNPLPAILALAQLVAIVLVFRWWRRRADRVLRGLQSRFERRRSRGPTETAGSTFAWYLRRIRNPLEWLALVAVLGRFSTVSEFPEVWYLLQIVFWALVGWAVTKLLDAMATRRRDAVEGTAALRWRSLRLGGVSVVFVGLLLSMADHSVGRGTLYSWIAGAAWLVAVLVAGVLVVWWRPTIFERIRRREPQRGVLAWVVANEGGLTSFAAAAVGGVWLLWQGLRSLAARQAAEIAPARRILAWLFRREVERSTRERRQPLGRLREEAFPELDPERRRSGALVESHSSKELARVRAVLESGVGSSIALVGERGFGKTTFLDRLTAGPGMEGSVRVACQPGGFDALLSDLFAACKLDGPPSTARLAGFLREGRPRVVCVDDAQRIVRPIIGGLSHVDRLLALVREVGNATSWVVAVGTPGFGYLERARGGRVTFDEVVRLEPWTVEEVTELVRVRTLEAKLSPSFADLVLSTPGQSDPDGARLERTERDFYGLLWDYSDGNAAVALHLWQESLGRRPESGEVVVRLPEVPTADDLEGQPDSFLFVLRAILQLELATEDDVALCTDLRLADVADAFRAAQVRGILETVGDRFRISIHWYRAVAQGLRRRRLVTLRGES